MLRKAKAEAGSKAIAPEQMSAYDAFQLVQPPYNIEALAQLYEKNAAHNAAVTAKAYNIVGLGYEITNSPETELRIEELQENPEKLKKLTSRIRRERVRLMRILESLNDEDEFTEILVKIWTDVESVGNGYMEIGRTRSGNIGYIGHVPAQTIRIRAPKDGFVQYVGNKYVFFRNFGDTETPDPFKNDPSPNEILHFKKYSPRSTYYGVPDIIPAMPAVLAEALAKEYNIDFFENKAVPRYVFITKGVKLSAQAEHNLKEFFRRELKGKHHGTLYIPLPGGPNTQNVDVQFQPIEARPQDSSFVTYIKESRLEILMAHRVPPSKVGIFENVNLAVSRDADRTFKEQVCRPEQRRIEKKLNRLFLDIAKSKMFVLKLKESSIIDEDVLSRKHDRYLRTRVMKPNEVRAEIGLPAVPEGEEFLPAPGQATGRLPRSTDGDKPFSSVIPGRAERGAEQDRGRRDNYPP